MTENIFLRHYFIWSLTRYTSHNSYQLRAQQQQVTNQPGSKQASFILPVTQHPSALFTIVNESLPW